MERKTHTLPRIHRKAVEKGPRDHLLTATRKTERTNPRLEHKPLPKRPGLSTRLATIYRILRGGSTARGPDKDSTESKTTGPPL